MDLLTVFALSQGVWICLTAFWLVSLLSAKRIDPTSDPRVRFVLRALVVVAACLVGVLVVGLAGGTGADAWIFL